MPQKSEPIDEESIGIDSPDGGDGISCRVGTTTSNGARTRDTRLQAEPGNFVRVSIKFKSRGQSEKNSVSARGLAYVDPITGKGLIRLGLYMGTREFGKQIVYETDVPVWKGNK